MKSPSKILFVPRKTARPSAFEAKSPRPPQPAAVLVALVAQAAQALRRPKEPEEPEELEEPDQLAVPEERLVAPAVPVARRLKELEEQVEKAAPPLPVGFNLALILSVCFERCPPNALPLCFSNLSSIFYYSIFCAEPSDHIVLVAYSVCWSIDN